jgi:histidinol-phosphate aminotransferase
MYGAKVVTQEYEKDFTFSYQSFIDKIDSSYKMVVFENPNGFIGVDHNKNDILKIIEKAYENNVLIIIDEAYFHYIDTTLVDCINEYDNLIIVRTFSKALGLASCRIGYIVSCSSNINNIFKVKPMHELTQFSINAALVLLDNFEFVKENISTSLKSLDYLKNELQKLECDFSDSVANFLVVKLDIKDEAGFEKELDNAKILIRRNFTQEFLKEYRRIGISTEENLNKFINIVRKYK